MDINCNSTPPNPVKPIELFNSKGYAKYINLMKLFTGRLGRLEYLIGNLIALVPLMILVTLNDIAKLVVYQSIATGSTNFGILHQILILIVWIFIIFFIIIKMSLDMRRFHDLGYTGWLAILIFVPVIGGIYTIILLIFPGKTFKNKYGKQPVGIHIKRVFGL